MADVKTLVREAVVARINGAKEALEIENVVKRQTRAGARDAALYLQAIAPSLGLRGFAALKAHGFDLPSPEEVAAQISEEE